jgi:hypothetical protein
MSFPRGNDIDGPISTFCDFIKVGTSIFSQSAAENRYPDGITSPWNEKDLKFQVGYKRRDPHPG